MVHDIGHLFAFFRHRTTLHRADFMEPIQPIFEEGMNILEDIGYVWCYRTRNGKVDSVVLTDLGVQKVKELTR